MNAECSREDDSPTTPQDEGSSMHLRVTRRLRQACPFVLFAAASAPFLLVSSDAQAVMRGRNAGGISRHVVKLIGHNLLCTATVVGRQQLLTANHCVEGSGPFFVMAGGKRIAVTGHSAAGQVTQLTLASPLPANVVPIET